MSDTGAGIQKRGQHIRRAAVAGFCCAVVGCIAAVLPAGATQLPSGFSDTTVLGGLTEPTAVQFSSDGRVFVAEKSGVIKVFDNLADTTPTVFADLSTQVYNYWDRGLLGLALDPGFPSVPYVYVLYTRDALIGGTAPLFGTPGVLSDPCPTPPGPTTDGCVASGRLSRLQASGNVMTGSEKVLVDGWCQQFPSHSVGGIAFGADGALYASGGEAASWTFADYGQAGQPKNPCGDPPTGSGTALTPPSAEGGSLRSQDLRTSSDPAGLSGSIIRVDPATGVALTTNPGAASSDLNVRRIIAYGLRNPFRIVAKPGTNDIYTGDVGWDTWEEINVANSSTVRNFGWPCYEGSSRQPVFDAANLTLCETLYGQTGAVTNPFFSYSHSVSTDTCPAGGSSISGLDFYTSGSYPSRYNGALFFADYTRNCIWALINGSATQSEVFGLAASNPVDLRVGPGGDVFYVDFVGGTVHRITYAGSAPTGTVFLSDLTPVSAVNGWGPFERDRSNGESNTGDGRPLTLAGTVFTKGLGVHAVSDLTYTVPTGCTTFTASVGVDDEVGANGNVIFQVLVGGVVKFDSAAMTGSTATKPVSLPVTAGAALRLLVNGNGTIDYGHADWADAKLACGSSGGGNQAPSVTTPAAQSSTAGQTASLQVVGSDPDAGQTLTWTATGLPAGLTINSSSGLISGTIGTGAATGSPYTATVTATDNGTPNLATSKTFTWTITATGGGSTVFLSDLTPVSAVNGWGPFERDRSNGESNTGDGRPLTLAGTVFTKGLGVHAVSDLTYTVPTGCTTFTASVGVDDEVGANGNVIFQVLLGGVVKFDSAAMTGSTATKPVSLPVTAGAALRLLVNGNGTIDYGHADWADAKLACGSSGGGNTPPQPQIATPTASTTWKVGDVISFSGSASDTQDGNLPASALTWALIMNHCPSTCHTHGIQTFAGVSSGSFTAPDHEYPSTLELRLTATDSNGSSATTNVVLQPKTVVLSFGSSPSGLSLAVGGSTGTTPFTRTVIVGSQNSLVATSPQALGGQNYAFQSWSDAGAQSHTATAPATAATYSATYSATGGGSTVFLSDLTPVSAVNGWGPFERDRSNGESNTGDGRPLTLAGTVFTKGLGVHAVSDLTYTVPTGCTTFTASVGVDDEVGANGNVIFQVLVGGVVKFDSAAMTGSTATKPVSLPVTAGAALRLLVNGNGTIDYGHADWADAKLACGSSGGGNQAPSVTTPAAQSSTAGQTASLQVVGSDPDAGQTLTWTATGLPAGLTINSSSGLISGTIGTSAATGSPYTATVTATDNGTPNLATSKTFTWTITATGGGGGGTIAFAAPSSIATGSQSHSVLAIDVDGDGDKDIVTAAASANAIAVSLNNGAGTFGAPVMYATGPGSFPKYADVGDINGDGKLDIASANQESSTTTVFLGNGSGTFAAGVQYATCTSTHEVVIADVNGDGWRDVVAACWGGDKVSVLLNTGGASGTLAGKVDYTAASGPHSLVLRDFDGDGDLDIAVAALYANTVAVLLNGGSGTFGAPTLNAVPSPHNVRTADLNGDGRLDLVATSQDSNSVRVLLGNGNGTFAAGVAYAVGSVPKGSAIGDLNGDGKLDLAVANTSGNYPDGSAPTSFTVLLGSGTGAFTQGAVIADALTPFSVAIADLNGDGKNDVATANWHSNDVKVFLRT